MGKAFDKKLWIGTGISMFFLFMLFRKIDTTKLLEAFREIDYLFLWPAVLLTFVSYFFRAVRWHFLLLPIKRIGIGSLTSATIIGYMANNLLPARLGEFVRAYALANREKLETSSVFATLVLDRLFDGFTVLIILLATFFSLKLPPGMEKVEHGMEMGGYATVGFYLMVILFLLLLKRQTARTLHYVGFLLKPFPAKVSEKIIPVLGSFIAGIRLSSKPADLAPLVLTSLLVWATAIWPIDLILQAFGVHLPIIASMFIMVFLVFAVMVPASPGFIGTYHFACVTALTAFNITSEKALSIAFVIHGLSFFPVIIAGFYCLWRGNVSLRAISESATQEQSIERP
ncbi:lysylphosphatidylglycerol synthase transmembrane domain-containing protein [Geobacter sp. DSM 9736]|uniref:lysylphosphatidylglycerol synthase transmembrane domain-containing protein n=1 Tax=Geobacter sp. DSM 9736 TaxID=1277350 RepID=UPI000B5E2712|nr:lysylphosphatidylglycerol synthase transmembrane domain-containing protein [Geobacter sp. DSM 9736]SNB45846.1 hypothetical protein SAMN06269301_1275 [Geobacter sp. DSM 9736]